MAIIDRQKREERGELLAQAASTSSPNGIKLLTVSIDSTTELATLKVDFYNRNFLTELSTPPLTEPWTVFVVEGGDIAPAGPLPTEVRVESATLAANATKTLLLTVKNIGDYSTYRMRLVPPASSDIIIDPVFSSVRFKFRPGCFECCCTDRKAPEPSVSQPIDYLAKDYDSFRSAMVAALMARVPGWKPTSEADLDQVLLSVISAAADELSDYQDRVMNEAFLSTARKRVSIARLARLMDYHLYEGSQASTWLALKVADSIDTAIDQPWGLLVGNSADLTAPGATVFVGSRPKFDVQGVLTPQFFDKSLNEIAPYDWGGVDSGLSKGATKADLLINTGASSDVSSVRKQINSGLVPKLLIQASGDITRRQVLSLLPKAEMIPDPLASGVSALRVYWEPADALLDEYDFKNNRTSFNANLIQVVQGTQVSATFSEPPASGPLPATGNYFERTGKWGTLCRLPKGPLLFTQTRPGGDAPPISTLIVKIPPNSDSSWEEQPSLVHSDGSNMHFTVEVDESGNAAIRFGNGVNGREIPEGAQISCNYLTGYGPDGNIGADKLTFANLECVTQCWNPLPVTNGAAPEDPAVAIRRIPETYRYSQQRAVTLADYEKRALELPQVSAATATYVWTGSWRAVHLVAVPANGAVADDNFRATVENHLEPLRLIGDDLEVRGPSYVPLEIDVVVCVEAGYFPEDILRILKREFSSTLDCAGKPAFFNPSLWAMGQPLYKSQILGRIVTIEGVRAVPTVKMAFRSRANALSRQGGPAAITVGKTEIIEVKNDPNDLERGFIRFEVRPEDGA